MFIPVYEGGFDPVSSSLQGKEMNEKKREKGRRWLVAAIPPCASSETTDFSLPEGIQIVFRYPPRHLCGPLHKLAAQRPWMWYTSVT